MCGTPAQLVTTQRSNCKHVTSTETIEATMALTMVPVAVLAEQTIPCHLVSRSHSTLPTALTRVPPEKQLNPHAGVTDSSLGVVCSPEAAWYFPTSSDRAQYISRKPAFGGFGGSACFDNRTSISWRWVSDCGNRDACYRVEFV